MRALFEAEVVAEVEVVVEEVKVVVEVEVVVEEEVVLLKNSFPSTGRSGCSKVKRTFSRTSKSCQET